MLILVISGEVDGIVIIFKYLQNNSFQAQFKKSLQILKYRVMCIKAQPWTIGLRAQSQEWAFPWVLQEKESAWSMEEMLPVPLHPGDQPDLHAAGLGGWRSLDRKGGTQHRLALIWRLELFLPLMSDSLTPLSPPLHLRFSFILSPEA